MMSFCVVPVSFSRGDALLVGDGDIERQQPRRGRVDRHRRVHLAERDAVEQRAHVAEMGDRHADLADFARGERVVAVVAGLGRQIEGDGQAGLALAQVLAVERVRRRSGRMPGIGAENPRLVACFLAVLLVRHDGRIQSCNANVTRNILRCNTRRSSRSVPVGAARATTVCKASSKSSASSSASCCGFITSRVGSRMDRPPPLRARRRHRTASRAVKVVAQLFAASRRFAPLTRLQHHESAHRLHGTFGDKPT